ncbi:cysteine--tRNA ligase [Methylomonas fluvii]|uniref:Cysteine--tRNA ligase n=1 Tax=Methylomonas fluvii TaxID=1854564 RepID=A0ABR9DCN5_9GAMM|nr:cysteine--tRNA ligase [Methylomonas fluvii]MBD9360715.1 cysteine--tRNA ligase [Methylomonas fluvii]CAD6873569.1 Cysteinyl-tRNA synthetase (EC 6.1.1.16) [Methylomonas fluvii]
MLKIYNTLTRSKQEFIPKQPGKVGMYVCGMTVYDYCHIGHARVMVVFDTVARYLRHSGYQLTYVRNITDIDDKIIQRANESGEAFTALTERFIEAMHEDERALSVLPPDIEPKATQSIADIVSMISTLIEREFAYVGSNGDVFYAVNRFDGYGKLSGKNIDDLQAGERVDVDTAKRDPLDFVLWKMAKPGEPYWDSPWGQGRPGWHIECSAMSTCCLGNHFDIHGGGMDLQFPHHENEIAQSEGATGEPFVNYWMHNGFVRVNEEKMSKSLGNFFTVREVLKQYRPEVIRFFILSSHYRSPLNYSDEQLDAAETALTRLYMALRGVEIAETLVDLVYKQRFEEAMDDDFNTPIAISVLFDLTKELNKSKGNADRLQVLAATLKELAAILGILQEDVEVFLKGGTTVVGYFEAVMPMPQLSINIEQLIQDRTNAKKNKDWTTADKIRDDLKQRGVILEDAPNGVTTWRKG